MKILKPLSIIMKGWPVVLEYGKLYTILVKPRPTRDNRGGSGKSKHSSLATYLRPVHFQGN